MKYAVCQKHFNVSKRLIPMPTSRGISVITGSPSSKYERRYQLHNLRILRVCMGKKNDCFCNPWMWRDLNKKSAYLALVVCFFLPVGSPSRFMAFLAVFVKPAFSLYISFPKVGYFLSIIFRAWATCGVIYGLPSRQHPVFIREAHFELIWQSIIVKKCSTSDFPAYTCI